MFQRIGTRARGVALRDDDFLELAGSMVALEGFRGAAGFGKILFHRSTATMNDYSARCKETMQFRQAISEDQDVNMCVAKLVCFSLSCCLRACSPAPQTELLGQQAWINGTDYQPFQRAAACNVERFCLLGKKLGLGQLF